MKCFVAEEAVAKLDEISEAVDLFVVNQAKIFQKVVQEIDNLKYVTTGGSSQEEEEEEEIPPLPEHLLQEKELTPEEQNAKDLYEQAMQLLNKTKPNKLEALHLLMTSAQIGNNDAKAQIAWFKLFGNTLPQNLEDAKAIFEELAKDGHPEGHTGMGFLYATGLTVNVSQAKALVHYTMGAIGGNYWAQMILGYRYWSGITVSSSCEKALNYYRQVANKGKSHEK